MPKMDPWINQEHSKKKEEESTTPSKFENNLLSIRDERQKMIIEMIDWTLEKL